MEYFSLLAIQRPTNLRLDIIFGAVTFLLLTLHVFKSTAWGKH